MTQKHTWITSCLLLVLAGCPPEPELPVSPPEASSSSNEAKSTAASSGSDASPADTQAEPNAGKSEDAAAGSSSVLGSKPGTEPASQNATESSTTIGSLVGNWNDAQNQAAAALKRSDQAEASGDLGAALKHALDARASVARSDWGDSDVLPGSPADEKRKAINAEARSFQNRVDQRLRDLEIAGAGRSSSASPQADITIR